MLEKGREPTESESSRGPFAYSLTPWPLGHNGPATRRPSVSVVLTLSRVFPPPSRPFESSSFKCLALRQKLRCSTVDGLCHKAWIRISILPTGAWHPSKHNKLIFRHCYGGEPWSGSPFSVRPGVCQICVWVCASIASRFCLLGSPNWQLSLLLLWCLMSSDVSIDILGTSWDQCVSIVQYCFTFTENMRLATLWRKAKDGHLDFHTAPLNSVLAVESVWPSGEKGVRQVLTEPASDVGGSISDSKHWLVYDILPLEEDTGKRCLECSGSIPRSGCLFSSKTMIYYDHSHPKLWFTRRTPSCDCLPHTPSIAFRHLPPR